VEGMGKKLENHQSARGICPQEDDSGIGVTTGSACSLLHTYKGQYGTKNDLLFLKDIHPELIRK